MLGLGVACTNSYLYDERRRDQRPDGPDASRSRGGSALSGPTTWSGRSRSSSPSTPRSRCAVTDPNGTRALAVVQLLNSLPQRPEDLLRGDALRREHHRLPHQERAGPSSSRSSPTPRPTTRALEDQIPQLHQPRRPTGTRPTSSSRSPRSTRSSARTSPRPRSTRRTAADGGPARGTRSSSSPTVTPPSTRTTSSSSGDAVQRIRQLRILVDDVHLQHRPRLRPRSSRRRAASAT